MREKREVNLPHLISARQKSVGKVHLWLLKRGCRRRRRLERNVVHKQKSEICPIKKIRRTGECGPVKPEGSTVASGRLRSPVSV